MASNRLTWDQVRAPDFEGVLDGFIASSNLIGNAMKTAQTGLDRIKGAQTENADNAVMSKLLQYQNSPDQLTADLSSGAFQNGVDMSKISAAMREHLSKAPTELLKFASDKSAYDQEQQRIGDQKFLRDNNGLVNDYLRLRDGGQIDQANALLDANPEFREKVNYGLLSGLNEGAGRRYSTDLSNMDKRFDYDTGVRSDRISQAFNMIDGAANQVVLPGDTAGKIAWLNTNRDALVEKGFNPDEINAALARYRGDFGNGGGGSVGGGGAGGGSGGGAINPNAIVGAPDDASAVREAANQLGINAEDLAAAMSYETGGKFDPNIRGGKNNAHVGLIQFGANEQAKYGIKPGMSIKDQMPAVVQYLKDRGLRPGDGLDRIYRTINGGNREANVKLSDGNGTIEEHIAKIDAQHRGNARAFLGLADPRGTAVMSDAGTKVNLASNPRAVQAREMLATWDDSRTAEQLAQELTGDKGQFKGQNTGAMTKMIHDLAVSNDIPEATAAKILARNSRGDTKWDWDNFGDEWTRGIFSDGISKSFNQEGINRDVAFAKDRGALMETVNSVDKQVQANAAIQQANSQVTAIQNEITRRNNLAKQLNMPAPDNSYLLEQLGQARALQTLSGGNSAQMVLAGDVTRPQNRPGFNPDAPVNQASVAADAVEPLGVRKARGVMRLSGAVGERQRANFKQTYGYTPQEVLENPSLLDTLGEGRAVATLAPSAAPPSRENLRADASRAIAAGAAAIAAFKQLNGVDPRTFLQN